MTNNFLNKLVPHKKWNSKKLSKIIERNKRLDEKNRLRKERRDIRYDNKISNAQIKEINKEIFRSRKNSIKVEFYHRDNRRRIGNKTIQYLQDNNLNCKESTEKSSYNFDYFIYTISWNKIEVTTEVEGNISISEITQEGSLSVV